MTNEQRNPVDLVPVKSNSNTSCMRCGREIKKKLLLFNSKKECFICNRLVCSDCTSKEERIDIASGRKGYCCLDCYPKTRASHSNSILGMGDINGVVDSLENRIPHQLEVISSGIEKVEHVTHALNKIIETINRQVSEVKEFSQSFTLKNWTIIKKDIYYILLFAGMGIICLIFIVTLMIMLMIKYIYPLL